MTNTTSRVLSTAAFAIMASGAAATALAATEKVVLSFAGAADGAFPEGKLIRVGSKLYGTTESNGPNGSGTVFSFDLKTGTETVLYAFRGGSDGQAPSAGLIAVRQTLYGTTRTGGGASACQNGCGTVFSLDTQTGAERVLYAFTGGSDGSSPEAALTHHAGLLYGTTEAGGGTGCNSGGAGCGTVFALDLTTGTERIVHAFADTASDGAEPLAEVVVARGTLYGTTAAGGAGNCTYGSLTGCGVVYAIDLKTGSERVIHAFAGGSDGQAPLAGLIKSGRTLYGTTSQGGGGDCSFFGASGCGTVYALDVKTGNVAIVYAFQGISDGVLPVASLIDVGGTLYGTTSEVGGAVFSVDIATGVKNTVYAFSGSGDGSYPVAGVLDVSGTCTARPSMAGRTDLGPFTLFLHDGRRASTTQRAGLSARVPRPGRPRARTLRAASPWPSAILDPAGLKERDLPSPPCFAWSRSAGGGS